LHLSGRNYDPETRGPKLGFEAPPTLQLEKPTLEEQADEIEAEIRAKAAEDEQDEKGIDLFKLQPKKPNWDLKRDLDKKLEILNVRTDNAIARLVRQRISNAQRPGKKEKRRDGGEGDTEEAGELEDVKLGVTLVEGLRVKEQEQAEEERRAKEDEEQEQAEEEQRAKEDDELES
jgi:coiled-coil domain-containing protein 12